MSSTVKNCVVISDIHAGCRLALCPPAGATLDDGGTYNPSALQLKLYKIWEEFWDWVVVATKKEPYAIVINGDVVDGVHHNSTTQISHNLEDQSEIAFTLLEPLVKKCEGRFYMIRGTEAHVGQQAVNEERLAKRLGARKNGAGQSSQYELWMNLGGPKYLVHFSHHIGTTGSAAYETTAIKKELEEIYADSAKWGHRHRHVETRTPTQNGVGIAFVTAGWQGRTPFSYRIPGGRVTLPQFGGSVIRLGGDMGTGLYTMHFVRSIDRPPAVQP